MNKLEWVIGIDPGAQGALAVYDVTNGVVKTVRDMPNAEVVLTTKKVSFRVDIEKLIEFFDTVIQKAEEAQATLYCHIERVQAFGKQSAPAAFNFGYAAAIPFAIATAYGLKPKLVSPVSWKRQFQLQAQDKDAARMFVRHLFPNLEELLKYKYHVDRADAILIAMYAF